MMAELTNPNTSERDVVGLAENIRAVQITVELEWHSDSVI